MDELIKRLQDFAAGTRLDEDAKLAFDASDAIQELQYELEQSRYYEEFWKHEAEEALKKFQVAIANKPQWIPFETRPMNDEEREYYTEMAGFDMYVVPPKMTNADRIRSMSDKELAEWIYNINIDRYIGVPVKEWLDWLKQEVNT